jgi:hypothetical protein
MIVQSASVSLHSKTINLQKSSKCRGTDPDQSFPETKPGAVEEHSEVLAGHLHFAANIVLISFFQKDFS